MKNGPRRHANESANKRYTEGIWWCRQIRPSDAGRTPVVDRFGGEIPVGWVPATATARFAWKDTDKVPTRRIPSHREILAGCSYREPSRLRCSELHYSHRLVGRKAFVGFLIFGPQKPANHEFWYRLATIHIGTGGQLLLFVGSATSNQMNSYSPPGAESNSPCRSAARSSNLVNSLIQVRSTSPVGPLRCFSMMICACPATSSRASPRK